MPQIPHNKTLSATANSLHFYRVCIRLTVIEWRVWVNFKLGRTLTNDQNALDIYTAYKKQRETQKSTGEHDYSLINSMLRINDEVRLHSRFLYSMINPDSPHYCGHSFLREFLLLIPFAKQLLDSGEFNIANAKVELETDNIDLLIHDDHYFIIIENKLNAVDQTHQLSRYVKLVVERMNIDTVTEVGERLAVVYLSKRNSQPIYIEDKYSLLGFEVNQAETAIHWLDKEVQIVNRDKKGKLTGKTSPFNLPVGSSISYHHLPYFSLDKAGSSLTVKDWVFQCQSHSMSKDLYFAFSEYLKIIQRLDTRHYKRNIMTFEDFYFNQDKATKAQVFEFLLEGEKHFNRIKAKEFYQRLTQYFETLEVIEMQGGLKQAVNSDTSHPKIKSKISEDKMYKWLCKESAGNDWDYTGFVLRQPIPGVPGVIFLLAVGYLYYGFFTETEGFDSKKSISMPTLYNITFYKLNRINIRSPVMSGKIDKAMGLIEQQTRQLGLV